MTIPGYQNLMSPILQAVSDGKEHSRAEITETLANELKLSQKKEKKFLPSRKQSLFANKADWALNLPQESEGPRILTEREVSAN